MAKPVRLAGLPRPGSIVEFLLDGEARIAWVLEESGTRLRLLTANRREHKLPAGRLLPWIGPDNPPEATREEIVQRLERLDARRRELAREIDVLELWGMAQGEVEHAPAEWFAQLLWNEPGVDELAAMGRTLLAAKTHFKFNPPEFEIHSAEKVEARLAREREEREREAMANAGRALFAALWSRVKSGKAAPSASGPRLPEAEELAPETAEALRGVLLAQIARRSTSGAEQDAQTKLWEGLKRHLPDAPHLALQLAQAWGIVPPHHNHLLDEAGYAWGDAWSEGFSAEIAEQKTRFRELAATAEIDPTPYVSIDAASTRDIDDAFRVREIALPDGAPGYSCTVTLSRPCLAWDFGGALDREIFNRATSIYLPEGNCHMMPEELGTGLFSLSAGEAKPAFAAEFLLDARANVVETRPRLVWAKIARNATYDDAQAALAAGTDAHLSTASRLARELQARRLERGAVVIEKPEPYVELEGDPSNVRVHIGMRPSCPDAELLISEFMILANCGMALWAREKGIPLLHRTQDIALPKEAQGVFDDTVDIFRVVKLLAPPILECQPRRHAALACEAYATITSPIRRYVDFLNMAQVQSFLATGSPRLDRARLEAIVPHLSARIQEVNQIQRFRPRYWKLVYLAQHKRERFPAVVVDESGPYPVLSLPQLQITVRAPRQMIGDKVRPGMNLSVAFGRIDPLANELKLLDVREAE